MTNEEPTFPIALRPGAATAQRQPDGSFRVALGGIGELLVPADTLAVYAEPGGLRNEKVKAKTLWSHAYGLDKLRGHEETAADE